LSWVEHAVASRHDMFTQIVLTSHHHITKLPFQNVNYLWHHESAQNYQQAEMYGCTVI